MPNNIRSYANQTKFHMVIWFFIILFVVGLGLIWFFYGARSALLGFLCLLGTLIPIGLISLFLFGLDKVVKKQD